MDLLLVALQLSFFAVFGAAAWRFIRRPGAIELALVAVFSTTAAIFAISLLNNFAPGISSTLQPVAVTLLMAQPVLVVLLLTLIRPLPRWSIAAAFAGFVVGTVAALVQTPVSPLAALFVAGYFIVVEGAAAALLASESRRRFGVARIRLAIAALATALFGLSIFLAAIGAAAAPGATDPTITLLSRLAALCAALGYIAAFVPPRWLRNVGQRAVAYDLARRLITGHPGTEPGVLWRDLAQAARDILGAHAVVVTDPSGTRLTGTEAAVPRRLDRRRTRVTLPVTSDGVVFAQLEAELEGHPLFVEDDVQVIGLLGLLTVRTIEREQAVLRLAEADRQLAESAAVQASETRFRALLEAHPNAVLAADARGQVIWATGPTGDLFGRPAEELVGRPVRELIQVDPSALSAFGGGRDQHLETTGRRRDGTDFPADVAMSGFELDGERHELIVVSDASWRHEANLLRDRFLGILSHELRTPITSIYGGTQLLQRRGRRMDAADRAELMTSIAAEAERLQRIIENLLILARVERGADFFEPRPVVVKPVLTDLVERERPLWPEMTIGLQLPAGLPLISADEEYLGLILRNLLSNAAKYAGAGATVEIRVEEHGDEVHFLVCDDGPGIDPAEAEQLFTLYFRSARGASAQGAGIGLFVCRGLVNAMGGRIWVRPRPAGGAEFGFALPVYRDVDEVPQPRPKQTRARLPAAEPA